MKSFAAKARIADYPLPKGYFFLTPVWGETYTQLFIETAIPAQLSPGNLPVFKDSPHSQYIIFTTPESAEIIRSAPIFQRLSETITVTIEIITETINLPHDMMSACHKRGIVMANKMDAAALFLNPDLVFADGSFLTVRRLAEQGYSVILVPGIRTLKQNVVRKLHENFKSGETLVVPPRSLMRVALDNLHPLADSSWWEEGESDLIPANLYWRAGKEGIVARCFHLHPLMVYPQRKDATFFGTVDDDYFVAACPDDKRDYIVTDSDELLAIELSDPGRLFLTGFRKESIDDTIVWAEQFTNNRHRKFFNATVRMHTGSCDTEAWNEATRKAEKIADIINMRLALSTWRLLITNSAALPRRIIRWGRDYELQQANLPQPRLLPVPANHETLSWLMRLRQRMTHFRKPYSLQISPYQISISLSPKLLGAFISIPSHLFSFYYRWVWRAFKRFSTLKTWIYGSPWQPYPWTWRYRYIRQLHQDMIKLLAVANTPILVVIDDPVKSLAIHSLPNKTRMGLFMHDVDGVHLIDRDSSRNIPDATYRTVVIERALPPARRLDYAIQEIDRVLHPEGELIILVNRTALPTDKPGHEICATAGEVANLLAPEFKIVSQRKQGAFAQGLLLYTLHWFLLQVSRFHIPFIFIATFSIITLPINIILALAGNIFTFLLDAIDMTGRFYTSSVTLAIKSDNYAVKPVADREDPK